MIFVGRAGCFCPIISGHGGGELMRIEKDGRFSYASGCKGYRWREAELVKGTEDAHFIDYGYFNKLVDAAVKTIESFGDIHWFLDDATDIPWVMPCGDTLAEHCSKCSHFQPEHNLCDLGFDISDILLSM